MALTPIPYTKNWADTFGSQEVPTEANAASASAVVPIRITSVTVNASRVATLAVVRPGAGTVDWGDGTPLTVLPSGSANVTHTYARNGDFGIAVKTNADPSVVSRIRARVSSTDAAPVIDPYVAGNWTLVDVPSPGGNTLGVTLSLVRGTSLYFAVNGGSPALITGTPEISTRYDITVPAEAAANVQIFAVSGSLFSVPSDTKTRTPTVAIVSPFTRVHPNGWQVDYPTIGTVAPNLQLSDGLSMPIIQPGYDNSGNPVSIPDDIPLLGRMREAWPNHATKLNTVVLARQVYAGDTAPSGVLNETTRVRPHPQTLWEQPDYFPIYTTDTTFTVRLFVTHWAARNGRSVAAVRFFANDGVNPERIVLVTATAVRTYAASGLSADCYEATFNVADFASAPAAIVFDAEIRPWIGTAYRLSVNGNAPPNMKNTTLTAYKVTPIYAYVDPAGNNATGVASATAATASANRFTTPLAALTAIAAATGRSECGGGIVRFANVAQAYPKAPLTGVALTSACVVFESINPADKATTILENTPGTFSGGDTNLPTRVIVRNMTLRKVGGAVSLFRGSTTLSTSYTFQNCNTDRNGQSAENYWINRFGRVWCIDCTEIGGGSLVLQANSTDVKNGVSIGCLGFSGNCRLSSVATRCASIAVGDRANTSLGHQHGMFLNNFISGSSASTFQVVMDGTFLGTPGPGLAFVGNIVETVAGPGGAVRMWADGNNQTVYDLLFMGNTVPGLNEPTRVNFMYSDEPNFSNIKEAFFMFNIYTSSARKGDLHASLGGNPLASNSTGNWAVRMGVNHFYNTSITGMTTGADAAFGPTSWRWEFDYPGLQRGNGSGAVLVPQFVLDGTIDGNDLGNGDYRLPTASPVQKIPTGRAYATRDQLGRVIPNNGTGFIGALPAST